MAAENRYARARYLEGRLRDSGQFTYSLEGQSRDPQIDPIEDFIANNPQGHCEYFATALALMLRSQGIPARVVIGYRTGEWTTGTWEGSSRSASCTPTPGWKPICGAEDLPRRTGAGSGRGPRGHGCGWTPRRLPTPPSLGPWRHGLTRALGVARFPLGPLRAGHGPPAATRGHLRARRRGPQTRHLDASQSSLVAERLSGLWRALGLRSDRRGLRRRSCVAAAGGGRSSC